MKCLYRLADAEVCAFFRKHKKEVLVFSWTLTGMSLLPVQRMTEMQLKGQETFILDGNSSSFRCNVDLDLLQG